VAAEAGKNGGGTLSLTIEDNGPGIPAEALERIFEAGYTTRTEGTTLVGGWPAVHRGLGLSIARSIVEAAGGRILAASRQGPAPELCGARFEILLPVRGL
jgi:two-component system sensor histidine kinase ChvG